MKIASYHRGGALRAAAVVDGALVDLQDADPALPSTVLALLEAGADALAAASKAALRARERIDLATVRLAAPVPRPPKLLAIGLNYRDHAEESGQPIPEVPVVFNKQSTCVTGPYDDVHLPRISPMLDYEGELGVVIGRRCRHVPREKARSVTAGFVVVDDVTVRDWQLRTPTWTMGKSFDTHGPMGPFLVTADELDPADLAIATFVNGELRQSSRTSQLIFDCDALIEHLSTAFTLEPGDVISTGTPAGVGMARNPPRMLAAGDVVAVEIEGIGRIENRVVAEPAQTTLY
ncbi:MAG TPA: fumarylacetoacetate hydrolase family protein [Candidatus Limnocylindrales bacterium]|nr:fumarylacetoacetate hydrolase family protein [Candidatus Limnocylindrales bacterium]